MDYLIALVPSVFAGIILYFILKWISSADRAERQAQKDAEADAALWYENVKKSSGNSNPFGSRKDD
ncbi:MULTISPECIES: hypothetical protein [unclassified Rothia (in: high G+C Gram-positive bacteria)]|uniref:hypothetical protein n=1 Tax=unclassified Rothia (in: high G+C Gram-positive bacteria) TaxID=2689056 RepID=UPI00195A7197|nr:MULTISPECIES: hypothetical protein [unclassified Rothia (in: high G+C Gram-positive bacteria)]MBM7051605.1 hypothetical protein [Rothia sp. ZJ1223]QRZ61759.1 hypothetical protein JR346_01040 [Rothia sp. ZJ932]